MKHRMSILVVEDEALIRMAMISELEDEGFVVFEAADADEAIAILSANLSIGVMFTDIDMPGSMDGLRLSAAVRDRWPPIRIIVTSGYQMIDINTLPEDGVFLRKPYRAAHAVRLINKMALA